MSERMALAGLDVHQTQTVARLRCFRGIDTLTAAGLRAEVDDLTRFAKPALLSGFLGMVPSEYASDEKRTRGRPPRPGRRTPAGCWSRPLTTTTIALR
jgi:transposase